MSTTFRDEKTYTVFVDILSSSRNTYGKMDIIPYTGRIDIQVEPRLADLSIYLNGANVTRVETFKVTPAMARAGIIFDATASTPSGGTQFQRTFWDF